MLPDNPSTQSRIRSIDFRKDLPAIADLIEICFTPGLDAEGRDYIRSIRQIAGGLGRFLEAGTPETTHLPFHGYVWEEDGRIIGNLTLIPVRKADRYTYLIANVAVHPGQRNRGIARQLTDRAIRHVREHEGKRIFLQVKEDNPTAIHIYQAQGFTEMARRTTWVWEDKKSPKGILEEKVRITRPQERDWILQKEWLLDTYPASVSWNLPFYIERLKPGFWTRLNAFLSGGNYRHWAARLDERLIGTATWESGFTGSDYVWLGIPREREEMAIRSLLPEVRRNLRHPQKVIINFPADRGVDGFLQSGLVEQNTLIWMTQPISSDASSPSGK